MGELKIDDRSIKGNPSPSASPTPRPISRPRPWYRLHLLTWAAILVLGSALAYGQFMYVEELFKTSDAPYSIGWPAPYAVKWSPSDPLDRVDWHGLATDVGWWFAMVAPLLILSERWTRSHFRLSFKALLATLGAVAVLDYWTDWPYYRYVIRVAYVRGYAAFELALLASGLCWLEVAALAVVGSVAAVWNRSSSTFTRVASYVAIGMAMVGIDAWLYSIGVLTADVESRGWVFLPLFVGAGLVLVFGAILWLLTALRGWLADSSDGTQLPTTDSRSDSPSANQPNG